MVGKGGGRRDWTVRPGLPLLARFAGKFVLDIMPAALASVIGGFLLTQYQVVHTAAPHPVLQEVTPASAEMMALVRDEHAMIIDYLKTQMAAEKSRQAVQDADAREAPESQADPKHEDAVAAAVPLHRVAAPASAVKSAQRAKAPPLNPAIAPTVVAAVPRGPLVIAMADPGPAAAAPAGGIARDPNSLLAKTLDIKDHVVAATRRVVSMIGDVVLAPFGASSGTAPPAERQFSSAS
jgi:hypothetical protein